MCRVQFQGFALSFIITLPCELLAFGAVDIVDTGRDKAHPKPEWFLFLLGF
jgi:hypothetical protein